ncbi:MAG: SUMF1/EgtB/PvdO family nonheme iron enzyme [Bryobacterales bacterium]|nr:SUMF1/EgtB/PvdO family nonheme iron enzyme [Bryobacterales bacterium]
MIGAVLLLAAIDFASQVQPVLESACLGCHGPARSYGGLRVDTPEGIAKSVVAGQPGQSKLYTTTLIPPGKAGAMPPGGPPLTRPQTEALRAWIAAGAKWPAGLKLGVKARTADDRALVDKIRVKILATQAAEFKAYKNGIPGSDVSYEMAPIPAGEFTMGTPANEEGHKKDESPQHRVAVDAFWMGKYEVTWDEYRLFMFAKETGEAAVDAVSHPTRPYVEMSFGMGINGYPAISMTQHAANKYAQWLSAKTGHFYRLPTEAEWEYACRAGSTTAYSFGDDASKLGEYAWFVDNSNGKYQKVGTKKPNPWGLYDMHGNVTEWTLDQYLPDAYAKGHLPFVSSTRPYPHTVRGGGWTDDADRLRCGARAASDPSWKMQDPQLPKSIWYHTDAQWLGFRLVRPVKAPSADEMFKIWNNGVEYDQ